MCFSSITARATLHLTLHLSRCLNVHVCDVKATTHLWIRADIQVLKNGELGVKQQPFDQHEIIQYESIVGDHGTHSANNQLSRSTFTHLTGYCGGFNVELSLHAFKAVIHSFTGLGEDVEAPKNNIANICFIHSVEWRPATWLKSQFEGADGCLQVVVVCEDVDPSHGNPAEKHSIRMRVRVWRQCRD